MLDINNFGTIDGCIAYFGFNHYFIYDDGKSYTLVIEELTHEDDEMKETKYVCSSISSAIATIEQKENGLEI